MASPTFQLIQRMDQIDRRAWNALCGEDSNPFIRWEWLESLERTGAAVADAGWAPYHFLAEESGEVVAACPVYLKGHSQGEFVFDYAWADFAERSGIAYYPKLLVAVPFTPVAGPRFLTHPDRSLERGEWIGRLGRGLIGLARANGLSSVHVNFCLEDESQRLEEIGYLKRVHYQFQWTNRNCRDFDDYLDAFRHSRRKKIKRERRAVREAGVEMRVLEGDQITPSLVSDFHRLYLGQADKFGVWGNRYLSEEFFQRIAEILRDRWILVTAMKEDRLIAASFNMLGPDALYGRYWGAFEKIPNLYFETCYYTPIEYCIERQLGRFEAGAGGEFKRLRGLDPVRTISMHYIDHPQFRSTLDQYLATEREEFEQVRDQYLAHSQLKTNSD